MEVDLHVARTYRMFNCNYGNSAKLRFRALHFTTCHTSAFFGIIQEPHKSCISYYRKHGYAVHAIQIDHHRKLQVRSGSSTVQQYAFQSTLNSTLSPARNEFPHESEAEIRRRQDRERYIDQIAQHFPQGNKGVRSAAAKQRRSEYVTWRPPSVKRHEHEENPFHDWQTALMMLKKHYKPESRVEPQHADTGLVRQVHSTTFKEGLKNTIVPPEKPHEWTQRSLTGYIQALAKFRPPRPIFFEVLPDDAKRQYLKSFTGVADAIESALYSTELRGFANIDAANIALQFFYDKEMMDRARSLYLRIEYLYLGATTVTWNIILRASASNKDLHNFSFLLDKMIGRGFKPDQETWAIFIMTLDSEHAKRTTIESMRARGIMDDPAVMRDVATQMVQAEFAEHFEQNKSPGTFFEKMHVQYGLDWLSTSTGNIIISEVIRSANGDPRVAVVQALRLVYELKQRSFAANGVTMELLLREAGRSRQSGLLVEILTIFENHWRLRPDREAHWRLFLHAWRNKALNFLRVIWASACLNGFVSFRMQDLVIRSVLSFNRTSGHSVQPIPFKCLAGWYLLSVDPSRPLPGENSLCWKPGEEERMAAQGVLAMKSNLATAGQGYLACGLVAYLRHALTVDSHWSSQSFWNTRRRQVALLNKGVHLDISRNLDHRPLVASSDKSFIDRLMRRKKRRLVRALNLRHKKDSESLSGMKIESIVRFSSKGRRELTFRVGPKQQHRKRRFGERNAARRFKSRHRPDPFTAKIFYHVNRVSRRKDRKTRTRKRLK